MAVTNAPPDDVLAEVTRQVSERLVVAEANEEPTFSFAALREHGTPRTSTLERGETFELWRLSPAAVERSKSRKLGLARIARPAGWHHQIRIDNVSVAFARSSKSKRSDRKWSVNEIFASPLVKAVDKAIIWADKNIPDSKEARLLSAPAYQVEAFWFVNKPRRGRKTVSGGEVLIISSLSDSRSLRPFRRMTSEQFLEALRVEPLGMGFGSLNDQKSSRNVDLYNFVERRLGMATKRSGGKIAGGGGVSKLGRGKGRRGGGGKLKGPGGVSKIGRGGSGRRKTSKKKA